MSGPLGPSTAANAERDERRVQVAALLVAHTPQNQIARMLNVHGSTICRDVKIIRRYWRLRSAQHFDTWVAEEVGKLDELEKAFMPKARGGDVKAGEMVMRIAERRARLKGLDRPTLIDAKITQTTELDEAIEELLGEFPAADADHLA